MLNYNFSTKLFNYLSRHKLPVYSTT